MPIYTTNFASFLEPGIRRIVGTEYKEHTEEFSMVFDVDTARYATEKDRTMSGTGLVPQKPEGQAVTYDTAYEGYEKTYTQITYGLGIIITREMYEDDLYRKMKNMAKALARSVRESVEILDANILNNAFSSETAADGVAICSSSHTTLVGGNYRNQLAASADLDVTSYEQMLVDISTIPIDDRGLKLNVKPQKLIIHPSEVFQAQQILKSAQLPDTANNNYNPFQGTMPGGLSVMHWLTDADAWFVKTDVPNGLTHLWKRRPEYTRDNDHDTDNAKFKVTYRMISGCTDPRSLFGSAGA